MQAVLVTGSRHWTDVAPIAERLRRYEGDVVLLHGAARGADSIAAALARAEGWTVLPFPADWAIGRKAGPKRNQSMLDELRILKRQGWTISVEAFPKPDSIGTLHMIRIAKAAGVQVNVTEG